MAQLLALTGGGRHVLTTRGLTYAQYARSGFAQLLGCAALTLLVLLALRSRIGPHADGPALRGLAGLVALLTVGVVITAMERLRLYQAAYGLTMLRLAAFVACAWIGAMFLLFAALISSPLVRPFVPAATLIITVITIAGWAIANPAAFVARTNIDRAGNGHSFDATAAAALGADAVPTISKGTLRLDAASRPALLEAICHRRGSPSEGLSYNRDQRAAENLLVRTCRSSPLRER